MIDKRKTPKLRLHKPSGRARLRLNGREFYTGAWDFERKRPTPEAQREADRLIALWLSNGRRLPADDGGPELTVEDVLASYVLFATEHYKASLDSASGEIVGSRLPVLLCRQLSPGAQYRWRFNVTKTAAGVATSTYAVLIGTAGSTADTAVLSFTKPAGTAAADEARVEILMTVRSSGASGILVGEFTLVHNLSATGHAQVPCVVLNAVSSAFDTTPQSLSVGIAVTPGASDVLTVELVQAEALDLAVAASF
jgi:hypothetical protein